MFFSISDYGGVIRIGVIKTLRTCFEMNDFSVFDVQIDYFFLRRVHLDVQSRNVGDIGKKISMFPIDYILM